MDHTRFLGPDSNRRQTRARRTFRRGHRPELVADAIVRAVECDRAVVTVGAEATLAWYAHRLVPVAMQQTLARVGGGRSARPTRAPR